MKNRLRRAFSTLLISYLVTMIFAVSIGAVTYYSALQVVERDAAELNLDLLKQSSELMDTRLNEVESIVDQLSFHPKIMSFQNVTKDEDEADHYKAIDTWNYIQTYRFTSDFIYNFYIAFTNSSVIMSPKDISVRMPMYYEDSLKYSGMSYEMWYDDFIAKPHNGEYLPAHNVTIGGKTDSYVTYLQTIPLGFRSSLKGTIFVLISEAEIRRLMNRLNLQEGGWSLISDADGTVISSIADRNRPIDMSGIDLTGSGGSVRKQMAGEDMLISYYVSPVNKWKYMSAIPTRVVMKKAAYIRQTNTFIIVGGLLTGLIIAVFFAYRNSKPIRTLVKTFGEKLSAAGDGPANEYKLLHHSISSLIHNNEALLTEIERQTPLLRAALLDRLFRGEFNDSHELVAALADVGFSIPGSRFVAIVLRMEWLDDEPHSRESTESRHLKRAIVKDLLRGEIGDSGFIHDLRQEKMAVLLGFTHEDAESCLEAADRMAERWGELLGSYSDIQVALGIGGCYEHLLDVYRSFQEALKALELVNYGRGEFRLRYDHIPKEDNGYYYPLEIEQRIMNLVKSGNEDEAGKLLDAMQAELLAARTISADTMKLLLFDLSATVCKLMHEMAPAGRGHEALKIQHFVETVGTFPTFREAYGYISAALLDLCRYSGNQKKSHNVALKDNIIAYLDLNYRDGNLSLASVADHFGITEVYLSQFFKEQTGENFSSYMENKRMSRARELLMKPQLTIDEIAKQVGYVNTNTFYKAFKRIEGVSPGTFRNKFKP